MLINTAGGMAGGDRFSIEPVARRGRALLAGTAAAEKIYRSTGADSAVAHEARRRRPGAMLAWLPQETILFDRARLSRRIDVDLRRMPRLVMAEAIVFGRSAMGEVVQKAALLDRWRVRRGGKLIFAENMRLDGAVARQACAAGGRRWRRSRRDSV